MFSLGVDETHHCRLCALKSENVIEIFQKEGTSIDLAGKILQCLQIRLSPDDILPRAVCMNCCDKVLQFTHFFNVCTKSQDFLNDIYFGKTVASIPEEIGSPKDIAGLSFAFSDLGPADNKIVLDDSSSCYAETADFGLSSSSLDKTLNLNNQESSRLNFSCTNPQTSSVQDISVPISSTDSNDFLLPQPVKNQLSLRALVKDSLNNDSESMSSVVEPHPNDNKVIDESADEFDNVGSKISSMKCIWKCAKCNEDLVSLRSLRNHFQKQHNEDPVFKCSISQCGKVYTRHRSYMRHVKTHLYPKKYSCNICGKAFAHKTILQSHAVVHGEERPHVCACCGKAFKTFSTLYLHGRSHVPSADKPKFICSICSKELSSKSTLETHMKGHLGEKNFICDVCGKRFLSKGSLEYHFMSHKEEKPFKCQVCSRPFMTERLLSKHISVHTGLKPYQCDTCGKQFRERSSLKEHSRIHTGDMPYTCEFCGKLFRFKGILTVHRRLHTGERPYSCSLCGREFTNWANHNKHMKRRHNSSIIRKENEPYKSELKSLTPIAPHDPVLNNLNPSFSLPQPLPSSSTSTVQPSNVNNNDIYREFSVVGNSSPNDQDLDYYLPHHSVFN